jgi:S-DNA-T family DNA segregation ATPase FtsK/SpoIIIE
LNASGATKVHNWIGPAGAYWADLLLQTLGVGSYALGFGLLFAGWRALTGKRVLPGFREATGTILLVVCIGAFSQLLFRDVMRPYPPGGVAGAILADVLLERFAVVGSYVLSGALALVSVALTADGVLAGLGLRGLVVVSELGLRAQAAWVVHRERRRLLREARAVAPVPEVADHWTLGEVVAPETQREARKRRIAEARARGRELAEVQVGRERELAEARAVRDVSEPEVQIDCTIDLTEEESFEIGALPGLDDLLNPAPKEEVVDLEPDDVSMEISIRAAEPESLPSDRVEPNPVPVESVPAAKATPPQPAAKAAPPGEPEIIDVRPAVDAEAIERAASEIADSVQSFELPKASLLDFQAAVRAPIDPENMRDNAQRLTKTLKDYGIDGHVREIRPGPVVTMYEFVPAPGIKLSKIAGLADDLAMSMEALRVRIVAPIPGKGAVGIEIPNEVRETVFLKEIIAHDDFRKAKSKLTLSLGKDIEGNAYVVNLARMPHLLVAGATGAGKSVAINAMIMSILFKSTPEEVRMIMVDPKRLELKVYDDIPHLLLPVVTDPKKASLALRWAVDEMERRYKLLSELSVRGIDSYNQKIRAAEKKGHKLTVPSPEEGGEEIECTPMPYLVVVVDELADLMMVASREVEASIMRLAQMARAAGIHLILATQRPSVDVLTGVIKANFPTRIAFQVASKHDSRTIIDGNGAEHLLGRGDMLYLSPGAGGLVRVHGTFVSDEEIERTVEFIKKQGAPEYNESILAPRDDLAVDDGDDEDRDEMYDQAIAIVQETRQASISMIQRRLRIGYNRAARLVERMETEGIVGPADGAKPRQILAPAAPM